MLRFAADENFNGKVVRGLLRVLPDIDLVRVQDTPLFGADDPDILAWAADENRLVLTHDAATMTAFAYERVRAGLRMPGVIEVRMNAPIGKIIEELQLLAELARPEECEMQVLYLP